MNKFLATTIAALVLGTASTALAVDGKAVYTAKGCAACHGPDGEKTTVPTYPKLKGQNSGYIVMQLKSFKAGERKGTQAAMMAPMANMLNDAEAEAVAKWLEAGAK